MDNLIYLDNAATTFPKPEAVYKRMDEANRNFAFNSGRGGYKVARDAAAIIEDTKSKLLDLANATGSAKIVFAPSVTIAINQILQGIELNRSSIVYLSPYEHNAVARTLHLLQKRHCFKIIELPIKDDTLEIDLDRTRYLFAKESPSLVCVNHISNVTGYILPAQELFAEAKKYSALTVLDAAQSLGLIPVDFKELKADFIAFTGHKSLYGPFGVAGFFLKNGIELKEVIVGGTGTNSLNLEMPNSIPEKYESSSPNIIAIAGLNASIDTIDVEEIYKKEKELTEYLISELCKISKIKLFCPANIDSRIGIVSFSVEGYSSDDISIILDEDFGIAVRSGYHCAPFIHKYLKNESTNGTIRIGIGKFNKMQDIIYLINSLRDLLE